MQKHPQAHPDKVKLVNLMKDELDRAQTLYASNGSVIVYATLVEGLYESVTTHYFFLLIIFIPVIV